MKFMIASDLHGSAYYPRQLLDAFEREGADRLLLLGDILYHGPRNDLPDEYAPKKVIEMLKKDGYIVELNNRTLTIQWAVEDNGDLYPAEDPVAVNPEKTEPEYTFWSEDKDVFVGVANTSGDLRRFLNDLPNMPFDNGASVTVAATKGESVRLTIFGASDTVKPLEPRTRYTAGTVGELACILAKMPPELKFEGGAQVVASYDSFIQKAQVTVRK